jgi:hypothetical protein
MLQRNIKRNEQILHVKAGKKIEFPVPAKHPLAAFQKLTPVRSADEVHAFLILWAHKAASRAEPTPDAAVVVAQLKKAKLSVLHLLGNNLRIDHGAVVTLNNPLNHLEFDTVTIVGDLAVHGDLILKCTSLSVK